MNPFRETAASAVEPEMAGASESRLFAQSSTPVVDPLSGTASGNAHVGLKKARISPLSRSERFTSDSVPTMMRRPELSGIDIHGIPRGTQILIVDDSKLYREYLASVISAHGVYPPSIAWDLPTLTAAVNETMPRIILLNMATRNSEMLLHHALNIGAGVRVIVMGMSEDDESDIVACAEAGVAGYFLRNESLDDLLLLMGKVAGGESLCSPKVSAILLRRLSTLASQRQRTTEDLDLTAREAQILGLLELGHSNKEIAEQLCIAVHTVKNHVHSLLTKLGVSTRAQAAALARTIRYTEAGQEN